MLIKKKKEFLKKFELKISNNFPPKIPIFKFFLYYISWIIKIELKKFYKYLRN
jgi:hypothetical protein